MDSRGAYFIDGAGALHHSGAVGREPDALVRTAWYRQDDGVRETAERSQDVGKSWKPEFDILFKPHK